MIGPEVRREFERWAPNHLGRCISGHPACPGGGICPDWLDDVPLAYPLWLNGRWYVRERVLPGRTARVWRLEESESGGFGFTEVKNPEALSIRDPKLRAAFE